MLLACFLLFAGVHPLMEDYTRAWALAGQRRFDEAIPALKAIIDKDRTFHRAYKTLAEAYFEQKQWEEGERYFGEMSAREPWNGLAEYGLGVISSARSQWSTAFDHFSSCIQRTPELYVCYEWRARLGPNFPRVLPELAANTATPQAALAAAIAHRARTEYPQARRAAEAGLEMAKRDDNVVLCAALHIEVAGAILMNGGARQDVITHGSAAVELYRQLGDKEGEIEALSWVGKGLAPDNPREVLAIGQARLALAQQYGHKYWLGLIHLELGLHLSEMGDNERALAHFEEYKLLLEEVGESTGGVLSAIARTQRRMGRFEEALRSAEESLDLIRRAGNGPQEAFAVRLVAVLRGDLGDYFESLRLGAESMRLFRDLGWRPQADAGLGNLGVLYAELGDFAAAREHYTQSLKGARETSNLFEQQRILTNLGSLHLDTDQPREALRYFAQAVALYERTHDQAFHTHTLLGVARAASRLGEHVRAVEAAHHALAAAKATGSRPSIAEALSALAECEFRGGRFSAARSHYQESLSMAGQMGLARVAAAAQHGLGRIAVRQSQHAEAARRLGTAIEALESIRARIRAPEMQSGFLGKNATIYEDMIGILALAGRSREAFHYAERARARSFLDMLAESKARIREGLTPEQASRRASLETEVSRALSALLKEDTGQNRAAADRAEKKLADWQLELRQTNPRYGELHYPEPLNAARAEAVAARAKTAILAYHLGETRSAIWHIDGARTQMWVLPPRRRIAALVSSYREKIARRPESAAAFDAWRAEAEALYRMLIAPAARRLAPGRLLIVPDGILHYLPFETLIGERSRLLVEDFTIAYAPSVSVFASLMQGDRPAPAARRDLLAFADPIFDPGQRSHPSSTATLVRSVYGRNGMKFPALPSTRAEVEAIAGLCAPGRARTYFGREASEASVKQEPLSQYRVLHFATHAVVDERAPSRSGVVLSLVNTGREDGILRMPEIFNLRLDAGLVVLSACQTGLGKLVRGEGMVGLTRAFLYAGSPRVAVTLWEINDLATAEFMKSFYAGMQRGAAPAEALRAAKLGMLGSDSPAYRHPYFWGAFGLVGAY